MVARIEREPRRKRKGMDVDVAVVGAGISGLWLANLLDRRGLSVAICTADGIGGTQTIAAQGIVHSGLKYALGKSAGQAAKALATMPARWRTCLAGEGEVDLRGAKVLAEHMHLHVATPNAQLRALFAKGLTAVRAAPLDANDGALFRRGSLLALDDFVLDVPALIRRLATPVQERFVALRLTPRMLVPAAAGIGGIRCGDQEIRASAFLFAAGAGNETLGAAAGFEDAKMRRRPLHQVVVTLPQPVRLFAHCLSATFGVEPDMTITSHGEVLYIGGRVASDPALSDAQRIAAVRRDLSANLSGIDWTGAEFGIHRVARAEPARRGLWDTGDVFAERHGNCVLCWPVKLSLAPRLGDVVLSLLANVKPRSSTWQGNSGCRPPYAEPPYAAMHRQANERC